jgi:hypothetical protein
MINLRRLLVVAASTAAICGLIALGSPRSVGAQPAQLSADVRIAKDDQEPAHSFVAKNVIIDIPLGTPSVTKAVYTVPAGNILVLQHISAVASAPSGQVVVLILEGTSGGAPSKVFISLQRQGSFANLDFVATSSPVTAYFDPGSTLNLFAFKSAVVGSGDVQFQMSGYLVEK